MDCLIPFVHAHGGKIVQALDLDYEGDCTVTTVSIPHQEGNRSVLTQGYVFIYFKDERVVVSAQSPGDQIRITVRSNTNAIKFMFFWKKYTREHNHLLGRTFFADGELITRKKPYTWDSIVLPEETKETIRVHVQSFLRNRNTLSLYNVKSRRGLILAGEPGTGKTLLGKVLADTLDYSFIWVLPRHITGAASMSALLSLARFVSPTILLLEDIDVYAEDRAAKGWLGLGELMNQLDGVLDNHNIITIATTNRLEVVENALRNRPGRFDRIVFFGAMAEEGRRLMVARLLSQAAISQEDIEHLIDATEGCTGAQLEEIANTIVIAAVCIAGEQGVELTGQPVPVDRLAIDTAVEQVLGKRRPILGFTPA